MKTRAVESVNQKLFRELSRLSSAEEFFEYFGIPYDKRVVNINRLHILKRFREYLGAHFDEESAGTESSSALCASLLAKAHGDFACSTAQVEKVFPVFGTKTPHMTLKAIQGARVPRKKGD